MSTLTIEVGTETALFQLRQGETTEQYKIPTGE
ncbi:MAG: ROK family protein, partial [Shewanella indica]